MATQGYLKTPEQYGYDVNAPQEISQAAQEEARIKAEGEKLKATTEQSLMEPIQAKEKQAYQDYQTKTGDITKQLQQPFQTPQMSTQDILMHGTMLAMMGVFLGTQGGQSATAAINAMAGYQKGMKEGNQQLVENSYKEYQNNVTRLKSLQDQLKNDLDTYLKELSVDRAAAQQTLNKVMAEYGTGVAGQLAKLGTTKNVIEAQNNLANLRMNIDKGNQELSIKHQQLEAKKAGEQHNYQPYIGADGNLYAWDSKQGIYVNRGKAPEGLTKAGAKTGTSGYALTAERVLQQDVGNAAYNLSALKEEYQKTGKIPAGSPAFANAFSGSIVSDIIRYATTQNVDKGLLGNDALLVNLAYDIASAQTGGRGQLSDAKVKGVVSQMPLDSEPDEVKIRKWKALIHRLEEANKALPKDKQVDISNDIAFIKQIVGESPEQKTTDPNAHIYNGRVIIPSKDRKSWVYQDDGSPVQ